MQVSNFPLLAVHVFPQLGIWVAPDFEAFKFSDGEEGRNEKKRKSRKLQSQRSFLLLLAIEAVDISDERV